MDGTLVMQLILDQECGEIIIYALETTNNPCTYSQYGNAMFTVIYLAECRMWLDLPHSLPNLLNYKTTSSCRSSRSAARAQTLPPEEGNKR